MDLRLNSFDIDSKMILGENKLKRKNGELDIVEGEVNDFSNCEATKRDGGDKSSPAEFSTDFSTEAKGLPTSLPKPKTNDKGSNLEYQREQRLTIVSKTPSDGNQALETHAQSVNFLPKTLSGGSSSSKLESISCEEQANKSMRLEERTLSKTSILEFKRSLALSSEKHLRKENAPAEKQMKQGNIGFVSERKLPQVQATVGENSLSPVSDKLSSGRSSSDKLNPESRLHLSLLRFARSS